LGLLAAAACLSLRAELHHRDGAQRERALLRVEMHRFGQGTLSNLAAWRAEPDGAHRVAFSAHNDGLFTADVTVVATLADGTTAQFRVSGEGEVQAVDASAAALAGRVATWGDDPEVQARRAAAAQAEHEVAGSAAVDQSTRRGFDVPVTRPLSARDL
jgi:hypothetical protein